MIIVRVELHSAVTGKTTELARMEIRNSGYSNDPNIGDYSVRTLRGRSKEDLDRRTPQRSGHVYDYPRLAVHVWNLVARALKEMGYNK